MQYGKNYICKNIAPRLPPPTKSVITIDIEIIGVQSQVNSFTKAFSFQVKSNTKYNLVKVGDGLRLGSLTAEVTEYNSTTGRGVVTAPTGSVWEAPNTTQTVEVVDVNSFPAV